MLRILLPADHIPVVLAVVTQSADVASGSDWPAYRLAKPYEEVIYLDPIPFGERLGQFNLCLFRCPRLDQIESVRDPVDVCVNGNGRNPESVDEYAVCGLPAHRGQAEKSLQIWRDRTAETAHDLSCYLHDACGL